jgi:hypothetical protein
MLNAAFSARGAASPAALLADARHRHHRAVVDDGARHARLEILVELGEVLGLDRDLDAMEDARLEDRRHRCGRPGVVRRHRDRPPVGAGRVGARIGGARRRVGGARGRIGGRGVAGRRNGGRIDADGSGVEGRRNRRALQRLARRHRQEDDADRAHRPTDGT